MRSSRHLSVIFETHATSLDNEAGLASGWFDVDLSALGEGQARALGDRRRADDLAAVYCSDLRRAWRTAELAFGKRAPIARDDRLRECDYGALTRRPTAEIEAVRSDHLVTPFPGGESYEQTVRRVAACLEEIADTQDGRTVLIIGHRATLYALRHLLDGEPLEQVIAAPWRWQPGWQFLLK
jgi:broad specificity phosphatase PhoE